MIDHRCRLLAALALALGVAGTAAALPPDRAISQYVRRAWTVEQGLPHGTVRGFTQTADGYLWLASYEGLVRFNGEELHLFERASNPSMLSNSARVLVRTGGDTVWIGTNDGLMRYRNGRFATIALPGGQDMIDALAASDDGTVWVGTAGGKLIRIANERVEAMSLALPGGPITALAATNDVVWIGTSAGLFRHRRASRDASKVTGLASERIVSLLRDGRNALLVGTATGFDRIENERVESIGPLPRDQVTAALRDRDGNLWVGTYSHGVFRISGTEVSRYGIEDGLMNPTIRALFEDDEGNIWIGSNGGLEQLRAGAFVTWGRREGLDDEFVRVVFETRDGTLWAGSANGLYRHEGNRWMAAADLPKAGILSIEEGRDGTRWLGTPNGLYRISGSEQKLLTIADGLSNNTIRDIHEDRRGDIWVATDFGVNLIHRDGRIESFAGRGGLGTAYAIAIAETPDGRIWVATGAGLGEFDGSAFKLHSAPNGLPSNRLFAIQADADNAIWLATDGDGLLRFRDGKASAITTRHGLASDKIVSFTEDGQGRFWFGTVRGVFAAMRRDLNAVADGASTRVETKTFDENDGLGSRQTNGAANPAALRTRDGRVWIATAKGMSALMNTRARALPVRAPVVERVSINGKPVAADALRSIEPGVERIEFAFSGVTFVAPDRMRFRYRLEGYDEEWIEGGTSRLASYTKLPAGDYNFVLASSRDGAQWRTTSIGFRLQPRFYETRWFLIASVLGVIALLLALHTMRLHLSRERARRLEKVVEERTRQISEEKERTEVALREAEAAKIEAEAAKREAEHHEQMVEQALAQAESASRTKSIFLATTSHELRTPLNAIIGFSEILIENAADRLEPRHVRFLQNILSSGEYLLGHINNILDLSKIEAGRIELQPETILLHDVVDEITAVMKGVATLRRVSIDVKMGENLPTLEADPTQIRQILYNLVSNAVKFSPEGSGVTVSMRHMPEDESPLSVSSIEIRVSDEGMGIDPKDHHLIFQEFRQARGIHGERPQGTGLGLALVKRFVEMHHGTIRVESELGAGSTFIVVLPRKHRPVEAPLPTTVARGV